MKRLFRSILIFSFVFCIFAGNAQQTPTEIKYKAWDIHALRYYPFTQPADSFMQQVINQKYSIIKDTAVSRYEKTSVDLAINKLFLADMINSLTANQNLIYKYFLLPYNTWLNYARPVREDSQDTNLSLFLSESHSQMPFSAQSPLEWIGNENIQSGLDQWLGEIDIWKERNEVLFTTIKSPLAKDAGKIYKYFFSSSTETEGVPTYEIAFFSKELEEKAFEGYLYITVSDLRPVKAILTLNPKMKKSPAKEVLFTQTSSRKETQLTIGDELSAGLVINQVRIKDDRSQDFLTPAQKEISGLVEQAQHTRAYSYLQIGLSFLFTNHIGFFKDHFDLGPVTQMLSYNYMEGIRLRVGGFTSQKISKQIAVGGYLAYGMKDTQWKYRGDIVFAPRPAERIQLTYVNDLNIPGYNCLDDKRDRIFYFLHQANAKNMSLQKIGQISYETDGFHGFSFKINTKYAYDQPLGIVKYETVNNGIQTTINDVTTTEIGASFRYAPNEKYIRVKGKRIVFHSPDIDFRLNHRIGLKGVFGSDYNYHITDASLFKSFNLPIKAGSFGARIAGGKVWNTIPFPLLFIPAGNQSFIFEQDNYNLTRFYEFITDRYISGNAALQLNWSPVKVFFPKSKLKTCMGMKAIYGSLSDMNNPRLHPELFVLNNGVEALGEKPYTEASIGLSGILKYLRIDYVYRLTYGNRGSLFLSTSFNF
jgi:hypothetical protein